MTRWTGERRSGMSNYIVKPCPFCGSKTAPTVMDQNQALWADPDFDGDLRIVVCCAATKGGCGSSTGFCDDDEKAVAAWNRREY